MAYTFLWNRPSPFYIAKTTNYTLTDLDHTVDCTGTVTITLPTAVGRNGKIFNIKNSGTNVVTINTTSSQTVDLNASGVLKLYPRGDAITVQSDNANWILLRRHTLGTAALITQSAAIAATTVFTTTASGMGVYQISFVAKVTTAASTSSILGGTNGFQVKYTDKDDSVVVTTPVNTYNSDATTLALNTTQAVYSGVVIINAKESTNIQYLMDYTSVGVTAMQYNLYVKVEAV